MEIEQSPRGVMTAFFRQSGVFLAIFILILTAGAVYVVAASPVYEANASMVIKFGADARPQTALTENPVPYETSASEREELLNSYVGILTSRALMETVVREMGADTIYPGITEAAGDADTPENMAVTALLEGDFKVGTDSSHVIRVAVQNPDPEMAATVADHIINSFIIKQTAIYDTPQTGFLEGQIDDARHRLEASQDDLQAYKKKVGVSAIDAEMEQLLREKSDIGALAFTALTEAQSRLAELEAEEAQMSATYRSDSPFFKRLQDSLAVARANLAKRQADLNGAGDSPLSTKIQRIDERIAYLESQRGRLNELEQNVRIDEENYLYYVKRGEEARINNLLNKENITRISVLDEPAASMVPAKPRKNVLLAITLIAAVVAGAGGAISRELLDDRLTTPAQLSSSLGVPVLATFDDEEKHS